MAPEAMPLLNWPSVSGSRVMMMVSTGSFRLSASTVMSRLAEVELASTVMLPLGAV